MTERTRDEHLAWCKRRALEYVDRGNLRDAVSSMISDMRKHPDTAASMEGMAIIGLMEAAGGSAFRVRYWIEGFQ